MNPLRQTVILLSFNVFSLFFTHALGQTINHFSRATGFIENKGQITDQNNRKNSAVKYLLRLSGGLNIQLRNNGYSYDTYRRADSGGSGKSVSYSFHRIDVEFAGANPAPKIQVADTLPFHYTYSTAQSNNLQVGVYGKVIYKDLYPSIDLVFERTIRPDSSGVSNIILSYVQAVMRGLSAGWRDTIPGSFSIRTGQAIVRL